MKTTRGYIHFGHRSRLKEGKLAFARRMRRCPTEPEYALWQGLRRSQLGVKFRRQHPMFGFIVDFWCPARALVVEVDGRCHGERAAYDDHRDKVFAASRVRVLRIPARDVYHSVENVLEKIRREVRRLE